MNPSRDSKTTVPSATQFSFEHILGWFGKFTPQFKFRLMALRRELTLEQFDALMNQSMQLFRSYIADLGTAPTTADRARFSHEMMEAEMKSNPATNVSCAAGCGACCKTFAKQITSDEADLLAEIVLEGKVAIDVAELSKQVADKNRGGRCVFLDSTERCTVYASRPAVCRKYHVTSPKENCSTDGVGVVPHIEMIPELIASAAMSMPGNRIGFMNELLNERLNKPVVFEAALPDLDIET